jgi:O-succinylbenzoate synthase
MRLLDVELITLRMPLVAPFTTSFGRQDERFPLLVRLAADVGGTQGTGWGECVALPDPVYSPEYLDSAREVLARYLVPALAALPEAGAPWGAEAVAGALHHIVGHRMAKAALEMAVLDAQLRATSTSLAGYLGVVADSVPSGVSVGIQPSVAALLDVVGGYLAEGYVRIKLKIRPGWDVEPVRAVRERFGDIPLQVDANTAYRLSDAPLLRRLDAFDLLLIEQPLAEDDLRQHAALARSLATPVCLDESITSPWGPPRSSTSSRAGWAATWRLAGSTTSPAPTASRRGAAACSRPGSDGRRTPRWPGCRASRCPATSPPRTGSTPPTSPTRWCWRAAGSPSGRGPG